MRALFLLAPALLALSAPPAGPAQKASDAAARLHAFLEEAWEEDLRADPLLATSVGDHRYDDRLPSVAREELTRQEAAARRRLDALRAIDRAALSPADRVNYDMYARQLANTVAFHEHRAWRIPINADSGFHTGFAHLPREMRFAGVRDYENYIARLRAFPAYVRQQVEAMREGLRSGFTLPRVVLEGYDSTLRPHVVKAAEDSIFFAPFTTFPAAVPAGEHDRLRAAGREAVMQGAVAGYGELLDFMTREYLPGARPTTAASDMPGGRPYYEQRVRSFTTLAVTPDEVHQTGLREVARIRAEMLDVMRKTGFTGELTAFLEMLRTDKRFFATTPDQLLKEAAWVAKRIDGQLPRLFGRLPRLPYGVEPVPAHIAPKYTAGRYVPAPVGGTRAGTYWVNTYALESRPIWALEALTLHEAVPGHHLQIALQQELTGLPRFRTVADVDAFVEGWALYAERLGLEAGLYQDPYADFGRLTYEMWRACRLVVDTGLHARGWTRQQALDYMAAHTALSRHEIRTEVDRYISWPAQALAYKTGELKIRQLRARAEKELGPRFDVRAFHDAVLQSGAVPLDVLEGQVDDFIAAAR
ncbi:MAG TPA: DUF885 domain-containing protein [Vicinamibacteria bacterium]|nr:DUF885 domain-containing protein [Vicinamibacteria bacterium]